MNSSLYLLVFPERSLLKIGKANDVHIRGKTLSRWWGSIDYPASFELVAPVNTVFRLEKSLHFLLSEHAVYFEDGDGKTELFALSSLDLALKHLDLFMSSGSTPCTLKKGLAVPRKEFSSLPVTTKYIRRSLQRRMQAGK